MKFTFHILGLPHTAINKDYNYCAYSQKLLKFAEMMVPRGHHITLYSNEGAVVPCENVQIFSEAERAQFFGSHDKEKLNHLDWNSTQPYWQEFNIRCIRELWKRVKKGDFILTANGNCSEPVANAFPGSHAGVQRNAAFVEAFCGYYGTFSRYRIFESHTHAEWLMGAAGNKGQDTDVGVVPNYWDMRDFPIVLKPDTLKGVDLTEPYYLFIGRVIHEKGYKIAIEATKTIGARLILAGQGDIGLIPDHVVRFGHADNVQRNILMQHAVATLCPTLFREPFGGTAAESQLCGTPAITTDQGAFTETVLDPWRCNSHKEFVLACIKAKTVTFEERMHIRARAVSKWSFDVVAPKFEAYFERLYARWFSGWYEMRDLETLELPK
jgi:glycosyltransferase involved in cell wall biosynthesis